MIRKQGDVLMLTYCISERVWCGWPYFQMNAEKIYLICPNDCQNLCYHVMVGLAWVLIQPKRVPLWDYVLYFLTKLRPIHR